jgi:hypothetical protein
MIGLMIHTVDYLDPNLIRDAELFEKHLIYVGARITKICNLRTQSTVDLRE